MFARSWKRVSSWLRRCNAERVCAVASVVIVGYALLAFIGGVAVILWGVV